MPRIAALTSLSAILLLSHQTAFGYCLDKYPGQKEYAKFEKMPVKYRVSNTLKDAKILAAIDAAFNTWGSVKCSTLTFQKDAQFDPKSVGFQSSTGHINIFWATQLSEVPAQMDPKYYFFHFQNFSPTGFTAGGSMAVNAAKFKWTANGAGSGSFDVQNVLTHFIGKLIGLADSKTPNTVMFPDVGFGQTSKRTLTGDEIEAIQYLYTKTGCTKPPAPGSDGCRTVSSPPPPPGTDGGTNPPPPPATDGGTNPPPPPPGSDGGTNPPPSPGGDAGTNPPSGPYPDGGSGGGLGCSSSAECAAGEVCTAEGKCVPLGSGVSGGGGDDGGCAVAPVSPPAVSPLLLLLGLAVSGLLRRRRG
jgi:MYXO-CTERM domain-containing protein